jgi:TPR repeat protein
MANLRGFSAVLTAFCVLVYSIAAPELAGAAAGMPSPRKPAASGASADLRCDQLADSPNDPSRVGSGVPFDQINVAEALPVCYQAAIQEPQRARYQFVYGRVLDAAGRFTDAAQMYAAADQGGYALATFDLGALYEEGNGVAQSYEKAAALYTKAGDAGVPWAWISLGEMYDQGRGVARDLQQVVNCYFKAGDAGLADGYAMLAAVYGRDNPPNYPDEIKWARKAVQGGSAYGNVLLGWLYQYGKGVNQDPALASEYYRTAATAGSPDAMYRLGLMYEDGEGVRQDFAAAADWFYAAGKLGHVSAQAELGYLCYAGQGVTQNYQAAYSWFLPAAQAGVAIAQDGLGTMYESGQGVTKSDSDAVAWFRRAAEQGDVYGMDRMGLHLRLGSGVAWNEAEAMQWFMKAAEAGYAPSQESVGDGYMNGLGGQTQDYRQAAYWLTKAAKQGDEYAILNLGVLYQNGWGVDQDLRTARRLYLKAAESPIPKVAKAGAENAARLAELTAQSSPTRPSSTGDNSDWIAAVAVGVGIVALVSLFSGSGHGNTSSSPTGDYPGGGYPGTDTKWPTSQPAPRTPVCHQVPDAIGSMTPNGLDLSMPTHGGGATHMECD